MQPWCREPPGKSPVLYFIFYRATKRMKEPRYTVPALLVLSQLIVWRLEGSTGSVVSLRASQLSEPGEFARAPRWRARTWGYSPEIPFALHSGSESFPRRGKKKKLTSLHGITSYFFRLFIASNPLSILTMIQAVSILRQHKWLKKGKIRSNNWSSVDKILNKVKFHLIGSLLKLRPSKFLGFKLLILGMKNYL